SLSQVLILNSWFMLWNFLLEVPTGTIADYWGRKASLTLGSLMAIGGALIYVSAPRFEVFLLANVVSAAGYALHSGADEALAYDSLKMMGKTSQAKKTFANLESFKLGGVILGALAGGLIASHWGLQAPMIAYVLPGG